MPSETKEKIDKFPTQFWLTILWGILILPTVFIWNDSILWANLMSLYGISVSHWTAHVAWKADQELEGKDDFPLNLVLTVFWGLLVIPTLLWWQGSVLWLVFMAVYVICATHWSNHIAWKTERAAKDKTD